MPRSKTVPIESVRKEGKPMAATEKDFTKVIIKDREGNRYTLEFNARVVKRMQRNGFKVDDYDDCRAEIAVVGAEQILVQVTHLGIAAEPVLESPFSGIVRNLLVVQELEHAVAGCLCHAGILLHPLAKQIPGLTAQMHFRFGISLGCARTQKPAYLARAKTA